jgi:predicted nucleic-acid-binding Zn-ribbon protein
MSSVKNCPKCGKDMVRGQKLYGYGYQVRLIKQGDHWGDNIIPFYCESCGYIELYNEKNVQVDKL